MRLILFSFLLLGCLSTAKAQPEYQLMGARAAGVGGAAVTLTDIWAMQNNIGALADLQEAQAAVGTQTRFNLPELSTAALAVGMPLAIGTAGLSLSRYGFGAYSLMEASIGFAHHINFVSIGVQAGLVQAATKGFGSRMAPVIALGGTADLFPSLRFGGYVYNITQSRINPETGEYLPTLLKAGLQWKPTSLFALLVETEKDVDFPARFKAGLEYRLRPGLALRTGFSSNPVNLHGGLGFMPGKFRFDYAMEHHSYIGLMHHLAFGIRLKDNKSK